MREIKRLFILSAVVAMSTACSTGFYSSMGTAYDDLYATHDRVAIAERQKAEAEARKAEAEARQAEYEAQLAELQTMIARAEQQASTRTDSDGVIIVDDGASYTNSYVADDYESAYARRLLGFKSSSYRMPSSYYDLRYGSASHYVTAYDPAFYNVMVSGSQVWVEPKYITSMFGTWGAVNVTMAVNSPWYYGFGIGFYDPFYYSSWGFPRYSWYDWNWNVCYGYGGMNLWWGWGGMYRPWHYSHYYSHYHHHHIHLGGYPHGIHFGGGGGYINRGGSYYGSRGSATRLNGISQGNSRGPAVVNRSSGRSTPYRSPSSGATYGNSSRGNSGAAVHTPQSQPNRSGSVGRNNNTSRQPSAQPSRPSQPSRQSSYQNNSSRGQSFNQGSSGRSSFGSGSSSSFGGSRSGGMSSGGGGSRSSGSRGR